MTPIPDRQAELQASIEDLRASREASRQRCIEIARRDEVLRWMVARANVSPHLGDALDWCRVLIRRAIGISELVWSSPHRPEWTEGLELSMIMEASEAKQEEDAL